MGTYINPGNSGFKKNLKGGTYRDKTGMISFINSVLGTDEYETAFTRPRRFGKTTACNMLAAYYSKGCSSQDLFKGLEIEQDPSFREHLNKHPVIYFDLYPFMRKWSSKKLTNQTMVQNLEETLLKELAKEYPDAGITDSMLLPEAMLAVSNLPVTDDENNKFIIIIDEWDMVLREGTNEPSMVNEYIDFLRSIFRSKDTSDFLAGAYMTGILPIIRYNTESALSDFYEYTMINPGPLSKYVGFTKDDVHAICQRFSSDEKRMKEWYDGYHLPEIDEVYCPSSVMKAAKSNIYSSYWTKTTSIESLTDYIYLDIDGLGYAMNELLDGNEVEVITDTFENRLDQVDTRDKVLTVLIHLGYLAYDSYRGTVRIPNLEVRLQMLEAFSAAPNESFFLRIKRCDKVLAATKAMDEQTIAEILEEIHGERPPIHYNDEQALRYVVLMAFNNSPRGAFTSFEELSSGKGFVDILFKPRKNSKDLPLLVELKHGESTSKAINQIHEKDYIDYLKKDEYTGMVLLIGINYSPNTRKHTCKIEKITI